MPTRAPRRSRSWRRVREGRVIERAVAHDDEVGARLGCAEQMRAAGRAETPVHDIAAVGNAAVVAQLSFDA